MPRDLIFPEVVEEETPEEKAERKGVPLIPPLPVLPPYEANPTVAICGACGLDLKRVMGYVCPHLNCPCFTRVTC